MYSIVVIKTKKSFTLLNECSTKRRTFGMLESSLLKIFPSKLRSLLQCVSLSFEKWESEEGSEYLFQQYHNSR